MSDIDQATAALRAGSYSQAGQLLDGLGAAKAGAPVRVRALWAIAQIMCRKFGDETIAAILDAAGRAAGPDQPIHWKMVQIVGRFEAILPAAAALEVQLRVGDYFLRNERADEAMPWLSAALSSAPEDPIAIYLEANCRFALYGERQAVHEMERVLHAAAADTQRAYFIGGRTAGFWYRLGVAHDRLRNLDAAAEYLAAAVELDPNNETPRLLLGDILVRMGHWEAAIRLLEPTQTFAEGYRYAMRLRAVALYRLGQTEQALALLQELAELDPLGALTFLEMGQIHLARGDFEHAELALARAFRTNPELAGLKSAIVTLEGRLGRHMDPDAGLPSPSAFAIPEEFAPRPDDPALYERLDLKSAWNNYIRVLQTLIVRDLLALHAHSGMGYLWAFAQPLVYTASIAAIYIVTGHQAPMGSSVIAYLAAGIVPFISFYMRIQAGVSAAVRSNIQLLYFRQVTPLTLIVAAFVREYLTSLIVFAVIAGGIALYDKTVQIHDPLTILAGVSGISVFGAIVGVIFGLGELVFPALRLAESVVWRFMFFFSGAMFYANFLPPQMRKFAVLNPMLHLFELVRGAYFANYDPRYANWHYPLEFMVVGVAFSVVLLHSTRRYMVAQ